MVDYTDALCGITQAALDNCDPTFTAGRSGDYAYLKIGRMHGVSVAFEGRCDANGEIPSLIRDGVVLRFLIPRGADLDILTMGLGEGGPLSMLIDAVLSGHVLTLSPENAKGRLTEAAALARDELLEAIDSLRPLSVPTEDMIEMVMRGAANLRSLWSTPAPEGAC